jgi:hypothetical protein
MNRLFEKTGSVWRRDRIVSITPQPDTSATLSLSTMRASKRPTPVSLLVEHKRLGVFKSELRLPPPINAVYKHSNLYLPCTNVCIQPWDHKLSKSYYKLPQNSRRQKGDTKQVPYLRHTNIWSHRTVFAPGSCSFVCNTRSCNTV